MASDVVDLVVVWYGVAKEGGIAATCGDIARAAQSQRIYVVGGGNLPVGEAGGVRITIVEERLVPSLHLSD